MGFEDCDIGLSSTTLPSDVCSQEVKKSNKAKWKSKRSLFLCKYYLVGECSAKKGKCQFLHACKRFLEGSCTQTSCGLSHDLDDDQNNRVLRRHSLWGNDSLMVQTRSLLPHICLRYIQSDCSKNDCGNLHICSAFVQGTCSRSCGLEKSHDLQSHHNCNVLIKYFKNYLDRFGQWKGLIKNSILILSDVQELSDYLRFEEQPLPLRHVVEKFGDEVRSVLLSNRQAFYIRMQKEDEWSVFAKVELKLCEKYLSGLCPASGSCTELHICKAFVLGAHCCRNLTDCQLGLSHDLKAFGNNGTLLTSAGISRLSSQAVIKKLRYSLPFVCKSFARKGFCSAFDCGCLHLCPHFAAGSCTKNCTFSYKFSMQRQFAHNLAGPENRVILESAGLSILKQHRNFSLANTLYPPEFFPDRRHALSNALVRDGKSVVNADAPTPKKVFAAPEERSLVPVKSGKNTGSTSIDVGFTTKVKTEKRQPTVFAVGKESSSFTQRQFIDKTGPTSIEVGITTEVPTEKKRTKALVGPTSIDVGITTKVPTEKKQPTALGVDNDNSPVTQENSKDKAGPTSVEVGFTTEESTEKKQSEALAGGNDNSSFIQGKPKDKAGPTSIDVGITTKVPTEKKQPTTLGVDNDNSPVTQENSKDKAGPTSIEVGLNTDVPTEKKRSETLAVDNGHSPITQEKSEDKAGPTSIDVGFTTKVPTEKKQPTALGVDNDHSPVTQENSKDKAGPTSVEVGINTEVSTEKKQSEALAGGPTTVEVGITTEFPTEKNQTEALAVGTPITQAKSKDKTVLGDNIFLNSYICHNWVLGNCTAGKDCLLFHNYPKCPYFWRYKSTSDPREDWSKFGTDAIKALEEAFCSPENVSYMVELEDDTKIHVNFETMTAQFLDDQTLYEIHRQTTKSSACLPSTDAKLALTDWCWYWLDNANCWNEYEIDGKKASDLIEKSYSEGKGHFDFSTSEFRYTIDTSRMIQVNKDERYRTVRSVRRRPVFKSIDDFRRGKKTGFDLPKHWPDVDVSDGFKLIEVNRAGQAWNLIKKSFIETIQAALPTAWIVSIYEVCNPAFFSKYQSVKETMIKKLGQQHLNEKQLYHGTDYSIVNAICHQNFDWRLCGTHGTLFGEGCYFATTASYSHRYCKMDSSGVHYMFYADVLTGMYAQGDPAFKRPPVRSKLDLYDSCVNSTTSPSMYIVFERDQCYPRFLIAYKAQKDYNPSGTSHAGLAPSILSSHLVSGLSTSGGATSYRYNTGYYQASSNTPYSTLGSGSAITLPLPRSSTSIVQSPTTSLSSGSPGQSQGNPISRKKSCIIA